MNRFLSGQLINSLIQQKEKTLDPCNLSKCFKETLRSIADDYESINEGIDVFEQELICDMLSSFFRARFGVDQCEEAAISRRSRPLFSVFERERCERGTVLSAAKIHRRHH